MKAEYIITIDGEPDIMGNYPIKEKKKLIRCKDCRWGREVSGNIECCVDSSITLEYHGYNWFCPNGERGEQDV